MTYPTITPKLTLDFANSRQLDPRITFSRSSTATYLHPDTGLITTAPSGVARFEKEGFLIEESRTNAITYSTAPDAQFNQDSANFSYTFNQPAPDGTSTAHLLVNTSNTSNNRGGQFANYATIPTTGKIVVSVFVKPVGGQVIYLGGDSGNQGYYGVPMVYYDFTTSPPTANISSTPYGYTVEPSIQNAGNGWYRLIEVIDLTNATGFNNGQTKGPRVCNTTPGTSTYVWGYQIETGSFPTSYIPTSGSTVTRSADVVSVTNAELTSWFGNGNAGTVVATASRSMPETYNVDSLVWHFRDPGRKEHNANKGNFQFYDAGNYTSGNAAARYYYRNVPTKSAFSFEPNNVRSAIVGDLGPVDTSWNPSAHTTLSIGSNVGQSRFLNGHINRFSFYDRRVSDAVLVTLTS